MVHGYFVLQVLNVSLVVWVAISCLEIDGIIHLCCKNNVSTNAHVWLTLLLFITYACTYINTNFWAQIEAVLWLIPSHSLPPLLPFSSPFLSSIPQKFEQCTHFIDSLCSQEYLTSVFPTSLSLLPPGLAKITSADFSSSLATRAKKSAGSADGSASQPSDKKWARLLVIDHNRNYGALV